MIYAIVMTLLAILLTYPGLPFVFALSAISAYASGMASRARGHTGIVPLLLSFFVFASFLIATGLAWLFAIRAWLEIGL